VSPVGRSSHLGQSHGRRKNAASCSSDDYEDDFDEADEEEDEEEADAADDQRTNNGIVEVGLPTAQDVPKRDINATRQEACNALTQASRDGTLDTVLAKFATPSELGISEARPRDEG